MTPTGWLAIIGFSCCLSLIHFPQSSVTDSQPGGLRRFNLSSSGLELSRGAQSSTPMDVVGRQAVILGRENGSFEMWAYPLKILSDFHWSFLMTDEAGAHRIPAQQLLTTIRVRPECTILTFTHPTFTVRQIAFVPLNQPAAILLLDVDADTPLRMIGTFRRELKLMWPARSDESQMRFDKGSSAFLITGPEKEFAGLVGAPGADGFSVADEGRRENVRAEFSFDVTAFAARHELAPVVIVGAPRGGAQAAGGLYAQLLQSAPRQYENTAAFYRRFREQTLQVITPDERLNRAFEWAKIRIDKGYATNPFLGSGLLAGFHMSFNSQRPGYGWFFGRDALWTALAITSSGDFERTRSVLRFLKGHQRADGKIMHELSQAASFVNWAQDFPYYYACADGSPLFLIALADYYLASGDVDFVRELWPAAKRAYDFSLSTDSDGNGLIENTNVGHGWVEGGRLLPVHEEIYLQGLWIEAGRAMARLAEAMGESIPAIAYRQRADRAKRAVERLFWNEAGGIYAFGRRQRGPNYGADKLAKRGNQTMINELTVMPAVPMWWGLLQQARGARMVEQLASASVATDWGARILSNQSDLYDPVGYHYGSVWPLFTGWAAMASFRYRRPINGYQFLMANARLTFDEALGAHTELMSGDRYRSLERSSFDQVWSSAMIIAPLVRGLLGLEWDAPARRLTFAPQIPADWDRVEIKNLAFAAGRLDIRYQRHGGRLRLEVRRRASDGPMELRFRPSFPLDAHITWARVNHQPIPIETVQQRQDQLVSLNLKVNRTIDIDIEYRPGTELIIPFTAANLGDRTRHLKLLRTNPTATALSIELEGLGGQSYDLTVSTPRSIHRVEGAAVTPRQGNQYQLRVSFPRGQPDQYLRKSVSIQFSDRPNAGRR